LSSCGASACNLQREQHSLRAYLGTTALHCFRNCSKALPLVAAGTGHTQCPHAPCMMKIATFESLVHPCKSIMASLIASDIKYMWVQLKLPLLYLFSTQQVASVIFSATPQSGLCCMTQFTAITNAAPAAITGSCTWHY